MFTLVWLIVWLLKDTPEVVVWNSWAVGLLVCVLIDILAIGTENANK